MVCWEMAAPVVVVEVTLPVELLLPVPLVVESSRLNENLFVTYSCKELKKLIFAGWCPRGVPREC